MVKNLNSINSAKNQEAIDNMSERERRNAGLTRDLAIVATSEMALANLDDVKGINFMTHRKANEKRALDQAANEAGAQKEYAQEVENAPFGSHEDYEQRQATRADRYDGTPNLNEDEEKTVQVVSGEATNYE